jgi:dTDP-4-dehydrorhamnose reductase
VVGGSSYIGRRLTAQLGRRAVATFHRRPFAGGVKFDLETDRLPREEAYSHAVLLSGETNPDRCAANPEATRHINVTRMCALIDGLIARGMVPIFASTESVFDGAKGNYTEDDAPNPILEYGRQKIAVENHLRSSGAPHLTFRLARVYGDAGDGTLVPGLVESVLKDGPLSCAADQISSPIHVSDVAEGILHAIARGLTGTYHLCGHEAVSRYDIAMMAVELLRRRGVRSAAAIKPVSIREFATQEARPLDVSMSPARLVAATGLEIRQLAFWIDRIAAQSPYRTAGNGVFFARVEDRWPER